MVQRWDGMLGSMGSYVCMAVMLGVANFLKHVLFKSGLVMSLSYFIIAPFIARRSAANIHAWPVQVTMVISTMLKWYEETQARSHFLHLGCSTTKDNECPTTESSACTTTEDNVYMANKSNLCLTARGNECSTTESSECLTTESSAYTTTEDNAHTTTESNVCLTAWGNECPTTESSKCFTTEFNAGRRPMGSLLPLPEAGRTKHAIYRYSLAPLAKQRHFLTPGLTTSQSVSTSPPAQTQPPSPVPAQTQPRPSSIIKTLLSGHMPLRSAGQMKGFYFKVFFLLQGPALLCQLYMRSATPWVSPWLFFTFITTLCALLLRFQAMSKPLPVSSLHQLHMKSL
eukprot:gene19257-25890_t